MTGPAWTSLRAWADGTWAAPTLADQDNKADVRALAAALVYARTGDTAYRVRVVSALQALQAWRGSVDSLAMMRQVGGWAIAAALVDYREPSFVAYMDALRTRAVNDPDGKGDHSRWPTIRVTFEDSAGNYGLYAGLSAIALDAYLGADLTRDWQVFTGYGDGSWPFRKTASWSAAWSCVPDTGTSRLPIAINPDCADRSGAPVEDASRSAYPSASTYIHEATAPLVVQALLLEAQGYPAWQVNDRQVCRVVAFADRVGRLNDHAVAYYVSHLANARCGTAYTELVPTTGGRAFGFTDWLVP